VEELQQAQGGAQLDMEDEVALNRINIQLTARGTLCTLHTQRRMRPCIADILRLSLYPNLEDGANVRAYPDLLGFDAPLQFWDHDHPESSSDTPATAAASTTRAAANTSSKQNVFEAHAVVELVRYAVQQGYKSEEIAVITPYTGQLLLLRKLLSESHMMVAIGDRDLEDLDASGLLPDEVDTRMHTHKQNKQSHTIHL
jgi:superfamily I DNA and/or RNA helicase